MFESAKRCLLTARTQYYIYAQSQRLSEHQISNKIENLLFDKLLNDRNGCFSRLFESMNPLKIVPQMANRIHTDLYWNYLL